VGAIRVPMRAAARLAGEAYEIGNSFTTELPATKPARRTIARVATASSHPSTSFKPSRSNAAMTSGASVRI